MPHNQYDLNSAFFQGWEMECRWSLDHGPFQNVLHRQEWNIRQKVLCRPWPSSPDIVKWTAEVNSNQNNDLLLSWASISGLCRARYCLKDHLKQDAVVSHKYLFRLIFVSVKCRAAQSAQYMLIPKVKRLESTPAHEEKRTVNLFPLPDRIR